MLFPLLSFVQSYESTHLEEPVDNILCSEIQWHQICFGQIFQNLISNAIKYMDKPLGIIKIGCEKKENYCYIEWNNKYKIPK